MPRRIQERRLSYDQTPTPIIQDIAESAQKVSKVIWKTFLIVQRVGNIPYQLRLLPRLKIHLVFHVSVLKPYHEDMKDPCNGESGRAPTAIVTTFNKDLECILVDRAIQRRGVLLNSEASWERKKRSMAICEAHLKVQAREHNEDAVRIGRGRCYGPFKFTTKGG